MKIKSFLALLVYFSLISCKSNSIDKKIKSAGFYEEDVNLSTLTNNDKTIVYFPIRHVGTKNFYNNIQFKVDSLASKGFVFFIEGIKTDSTKLSIQRIDTLELKLRKIVGGNVNIYVDTINSTYMGYPFKNNKGLINQPKYSKLGISKTNSEHSDVSLDLLIDEYENKFGTIVLNECDYNTSPNTVYQCITVPENNKKYIVLDFRDIKLAKYITDSPHKKIAVIYGSNHEKGLYRELTKMDSLWTYLSK
ncbi:hypothetical protein V1389_13190 [Flavobacterium rakeshii]|uniref:hypothetical protein n=1 Tax=Flavobacterium rakeshii TaxID=1038845 RepID=UPI002E7B241A|nr:hypothetical protein [Flavobacterium rakeshii]MEE1899299.1 hypothetical protein [Flavobacterium rakeshii]